MVKQDWEQRQEYLTFLGAVRDEHPSPTPLKDVARIVVQRIEEDAARGVIGPAIEEWRATKNERDVESVYEDLRHMERLRNQIYTKAAATVAAPTVVLPGTVGLRNPITKQHERPATKTINRQQFQRWRARQLVLFTTEQEKMRWADEVSTFWDKNPELPTLEAVCEAAGIPFEPAIAAEMA